jgi:hypothetical protein
MVVVTPQLMMRKVARTPNHNRNAAIVIPLGSNNRCVTTSGAHPV